VTALTGPLERDAMAGRSGGAAPGRAADAGSRRAGQAP
jgi:hypothetical protein